jgi:hypothetical protein
MALSFEFDFEVTKAALVYLASKNLPKFDKYRAVKLLFLADREHLLRFGRPITGDKYNALPFGPTGDRVLDLLGELERVALEGEVPKSVEVAELVTSLAVAEDEYSTYHAKVEPDWDALSKSDIKVLDRVVEEHGTKSFEELKKFTHELKAYQMAWRDNVAQRKFPMVFDDFFAEEPEHSAFLNELRENQAIASAFSKAMSV